MITLSQVYEIRDAKGNEICAGDDVIFNRSGELAQGTVIEAKVTRVEKHIYFRDRVHYRIKILRTNGDKSVVLNPLGIICLKGVKGGL